MQFLFLFDTLKETEQSRRTNQKEIRHWDSVSHWQKDDTIEQNDSPELCHFASWIALIKRLVKNSEWISLKFKNAIIPQLRNTQTDHLKQNKAKAGINNRITPPQEAPASDQANRKPSSPSSSSLLPYLTSPPPPPLSFFSSSVPSTKENKIDTQ